MSSRAICVYVLLILAAVSSAEASAIRTPVAESTSFDALTGRYWARVSDPRHPAAPPRLVVSAGQQRIPAKQLCVHPGDRMLVTSGAADSALQLRAVALSAAAAGDPVRVRLDLTGAVVMMKVVDANSGILLGPARRQP